MSNTLQLLCDLSEASDQTFRDNAVESHWLDSLKVLARLGAIEAGPPPHTIACSECDGDHPADIEYDAERRCFRHSCGKAGFVWVDDANLRTHRFRPEWMVDWLVAALPTVTLARRSVLVPQHVWHLGDTACGGTVVTVVFARRVIAQTDLDRLAAVLRSVHRADKGVVVTTSSHFARQVKLPRDYELLPLWEIVRTGSHGLVLDADRLGTWISNMGASTAKGAPSKEGRPTQKSHISRIFDLRRSREIPIKSYSAEAEAIRDEWKQHAPDQDRPALSTARGHVARLARGRE
jgi:hypothetical protein